jgi:hypothetical protein
MSTQSRASFPVKPGTNGEPNLPTLRPPPVVRCAGCINGAAYQFSLLVEIDLGAAEGQL